MDSLTFHFGDIWTGLPLLGKGLLFTVILSLLSFSAALVFGTILGLLREERLFGLDKLATLYIELVRGVPLILFLLFMHYGILPLLIGNPSFFVSALLSFILFESAYVAEIVRSGLKSVNRTERESARSLGLPYSTRLTHIILPLAFSRVMPALVGQFVSLIKDTSLASIVGVIELTRAGEIIYEQTYRDFEILLFQAVVYFLLCYSISRLGQRFEAGQNPEERLALKTIQT